MSATVRLPQLGLLQTIGDLVAFHPASVVGQVRTRSAERRAEEALALMPAHVRDDMGLPPVPPTEPEHPAMTTARIRGRNWG